ncbi:hypothetical protein [Streptomyces canus]|uniref:hypothetical protein n=1 Tax=Streptomyces canus TaxID=58343 RepID=UPI002E28CAA0|nr:hypothetical protein [Streptomyces canus]
MDAATGPEAAEIALDVDADQALVPGGDASVHGALPDAPARLDTQRDRLRLHLDAAMPWWAEHCFATRRDVPASPAVADRSPSAEAWDGVALVKAACG